jgi:hypothetical protein
MEARSATRSDLAKVFRHLAHRMSAEYANAGFSIVQAKQLFTKHVDQGTAHALVEEGRVVAVISWEIQGDTAHTSFAATEEFFQGKFMPWFRDHLRVIQALAGGIELRSASYSDLESVPTWFKRLGYLAPVPAGKAMIYVLPAATAKID